MSPAFWNPFNIFAGIPATLTRCKDDTHSHLRFDIIQNDKQFRLAVDVPGLKPNNFEMGLEDDGRVLHVSGGRKVKTDLKIELEDDCRVLHISGGRKFKSDTSYDNHTFDTRFILGSNVDTSKLTAHPFDGVLMLTAPKREHLPTATQPIAIVQGEAPSLLDVDEEKKSGEVVDEEKKSDEMEA
jgi:HSP20 family molecular chaperone IbpA